MVFKKGQIVYGSSQDYGECIIQLVNKIIKNVKGEKLKSPIWTAFILDSSMEIMDSNFIDFLLEKKHTPGFFENYNKINFMKRLNETQGGSE